MVLYFIPGVDCKSQVLDGLGACMVRGLQGIGEYAIVNKLHTNMIYICVFLRGKGVGGIRGGGRGEDALWDKVKTFSQLIIAMIEAL